MASLFQVYNTIKINWTKHKKSKSFQKLRYPKQWFFNYTEEAILKGVINSLTGAVNSLFNPVKDILVICGGDSEFLTKSLNTQKENIINAPN